MKRALIFMICLLCMTAAIPTYASEIEKEETTQSGLSLTVVVPAKEVDQQQTPTPEPELNQGIHYLYPVSVWETRDNGRREIIKTYELSENEKPEYISREPFEREGWRYELADITKNEMASHSAKEHTETITVGTETKDMEAVIKLLAPTIEFQSEDGYAGILSLDMASIKIEQAGSKTSSYTVNATREYPHLSANDTSLVPKTITDNGKTLTLTGVNWKTLNAETVDYNQLPASYTAVATYSGTASKTSVTGYTTTAEYKGALTRITTGKTKYSANFVGMPILTPEIDEMAGVSEDYLETNITVEELAEQAAAEQKPADESVAVPTEVTSSEFDKDLETEFSAGPPTETETATGVEQEKKPFNPLPIILIILALGIGGSLYYLIKKKGSFEAIKKMFCLALMLMIAASTPKPAFADSYNYGFESGADSDTVFGSPTSTDNPISVNPETENIRRNKDAAYFPPSYGVFSGDIPTDRTSLYHDNSVPYSGYTGNTSTSAYGAGTASDLNSAGGNVSTMTGADSGGLLPSTSVYTPEAVNTLPQYYDDGSLGTLSIPKLDLKVKVYEGETLDSMRKGIGHFEYTSVWDGTVGFAGHNRGLSGYFEGVKNLKNGDTLTYSTKYGTRTYEVYHKEKISDTDYSSLSWSAENTVVLITCAENEPSKRWCIMAREI